MPSQTCPRGAPAQLGAHMWEPALSKDICQQLSHRRDPSLTKSAAPNHPTAAAENRHNNALSPARRKTRSSILGRYQSPVFVGFYSMQENKA